MSVLDYRDRLTDKPVYKTNQFCLYKYTDNYYKLYYFKTPKRSPGYELEFDKNKKARENVNNERFSNSLYRAKETVFELAMCNPFQYFVTLTINKDKFNRTDLSSFYKTNVSHCVSFNYVYKRTRANTSEHKRTRFPNIMAKS